MEQSKIMQKLTPNLWFDTEAEEAAKFYVSVFDNSTLGTVNQYDPASAAASGQSEGSVMTVAFELEDQEFVALNGGPQFRFTPAVSFIVYCHTKDEVDQLWAELSDGGTEHMPLDTYPFSDKYGWTEDKYGVSWQLMFDDDSPEQKIVPSLMFVGDQCGNAEEAISFYTSIFRESDVGEINRYGPNEGPDEEGTVMFADVTLEGQRFAAMDSAREHNYGFSEAISFIVDCQDQEEVDYFWENLTENGGEKGQCGWLEDPYGVSWQIVPTVLSELLEDAEHSAQVTEALLQMKKIDSNRLREAHAQ